MKEIIEISRVFRDNDGFTKVEEENGEISEHVREIRLPLIHEDDLKAPIIIMDIDV